jgi:hypothetical protein
VLNFQTRTTPTPGDGATTSCIAELLAAAVAAQTGVTVLEARQNMWLFDSSGLVTRGRWAAGFEGGSGFRHRLTRISLPNRPNDRPTLTASNQPTNRR